MQNKAVKVWYKQFWPWFLIIVPVCSMVLSFTMMNFAFNTQDSMVIDDYYKEGKGINLQLQKIQRAKELNITALIQIDRQSVSLTFNSGKLKQGQPIVLDFIHTTQDFKDFSVTLLRDANGTYRAPIEKSIAGKWLISLHSADQEWKINKTLVFPRTEPFELAP